MFKYHPGKEVLESILSSNPNAKIYLSTYAITTNNEPDSKRFKNINQEIYIMESNKRHIQCTFDID